MERFVIIDVETTGVSFLKGDRIIQIAYVIIENNQVIERFDSYINPGRGIPSFIQTLTNIDNNLVKDAPQFSEVASILLSALDNGAYFVAHNVEFDLYFINDELEAAGYEPFSGPVLDTVELARIAFPTAEGFSLSRLSESFRMEHNSPHRADSDAEATGQLLVEIINKLSHLPYTTLVQLDKLRGKLKSDLGVLIHQWQLLNLDKDLKENWEEFRGLVLKNTNVKKDSDNQNDIDASLPAFLEECMKNEDWCKEKITGYETRPGQIEMMTFIHEVFNDSDIGLIEAQTGTGKTLAYLLPAAFKAKELNKPIVISTQTIQLQEQLVKKEIPILTKMIPFSLQIALLKGRSHYLCLRKFERLLQDDPNETYDKIVSKAQILVWLTETESGDVEELSLASSTNRFWNDIASDSFSCISPRCPWFSRCFYQRAKTKAKDAQLIITNHSLVLSDSMSEHQLIPTYDYIILDEAHHFEETATDQFGVNIDYLSFTHLFNEMSGKEGDGLLASLQPIFAKDLTSIDILISVEENTKEVKQEWNDLFLLLHQFVHTNNAKQNERGRVVTTIDIENSRWKPVNESIKRFQVNYQEWLASLKELSSYLEKQIGKQLARKKYGSAFNTYLDRIEKVYTAFVKLLIQHDQESIYWLESDRKGPKQSVFIQSKPINVSDLLADRFFRKKQSVILTSATMSVNKDFAYMEEKLGLQDFPTKTKIVSSPFNWEDQVKLMVPTDMPLIQEVGESSFIEAAVLQIYRIAEVSKGKMLVLFTSYDMLKKSYNFLKEMLSDEFMLIGQGIQTGSRSKLTKHFQQFDQAILLGTSSFWEGVDIPGRDLSVIVIVRLPFTPPDDPVFQAKSSKMKKEGVNPFMKLALPQAVLRFKQGFGRLIRKTSDKGVVVVLDRRICTTSYGNSFIKSLPPIPFIYKSMDDLENDLSNWL
ncbi:ATP-dependent DNA helicase DinG [Evansella sp. AB-rgal1]|uniref:ATP-dependent DNA helicase DinG n=1 Tax=Evansella sp. AB-rgal1 TaxID=3242696 RepID=UPI00359DFD46